MLISTLTNPIKPASSAKIIDGKLILSFPDAQTPIIWQMDFGAAKMSALEIRSLEDKTQLLLTAPKSDTIEIASFNDKNQAVEHLVSISKALDKAHGNIRQKDSDQTKTNPFIKTVKIALMVIGALAIIMPLLRSMSPNPAMTGAQSPSPATAPQSSGTPMSAEDFLNGQ